MSEEQKPSLPEALPNDQFIRLNCLQLAVPAMGILTQTAGGDVEQARAKVLKIAKTFETFVISGTVVGNLAK